MSYRVPVPKAGRSAKEQAHARRQVEQCRLYLDTMVFGMARQAVSAAASGSECAICFEDPAQLLVFLPCGHRCVCASCAERIERRCPLCRARVRDRIAVVGKHKFRV